jgi:hypothetical protein
VKIGRPVLLKLTRGEGIVRLRDVLLSASPGESGIELCIAMVAVPARPCRRRSPILSDPFSTT